MVHNLDLLIYNGLMEWADGTIARYRTTAKEGGCAGAHAGAGEMKALYGFYIIGAAKIYNRISIPKALKSRKEDCKLWLE